MDILKQYFNSFLNKVYSFLCSVLPRSPFRAYLRGYDGGHNGLLRAVNFFVPIPQILFITAGWVTAMFLYYLYHALVLKLWEGRDKQKASYFNKLINFIKKIVGKI